MNLVYDGVSIWNYKVSSKSLILLYPLFVVIGKIVRWTVMYGTLVDFSKGWDAVDIIINEGFHFQFFGLDEIVATDSDSWGNAIALFKIVRGMFFFVLDSFQTFEVAITILWGGMLLLVLCKIKEQIDVIQWLFIMLSCIVLNIFDFALAKEPIQMLYFFMIFIILVSTRLSITQKVIGAYGTIVLSVLTFRVYFVLIIFFAFVFEFAIRSALWRDKNKYRNKNRNKNERLPWTKIGIVFLIMFVSYLVFMAILFVVNGNLFNRFADSLLTASDATRSSNTYIENMIAEEGTSNVLFIALEYVAVVVRMSFPVELLRLGYKYYPYIAYQIFITILTLKSLYAYKENKREQNIALAIYMGFLFASCTFEVDFGAWIRHGAVTFPILVVMIGVVPIRKCRGVRQYERQFE